ncbi:methyltransferase domain-containing protein [Colletotrichum tofieldiae]|nr:methyltransferase domain-containing protein [Colletotrichum tofieldiae]GKT80686.1 methyltransferase domain-containing protein [Colletotrichum tofieldiae]GKT88813.1 methyltransferase domain-containing protein [Colletotrichum tofieldiae]
MSSNPGSTTAQPTTANPADVAEPVAAQGSSNSTAQPAAALTPADTTEADAAPLPVVRNISLYLRLVICTYQPAFSQDPAIEDSDYSTDTQSILTSSTASVSDSVREYREIHGRSFTQKTEYWGPNDEQQNDALDFNDFADTFPSADVIGVDISPIQPSWVPSNCRFQIDDFEKEWTFNEKFDFIHARNLEGCIADLPALFEQCFAHTKPEGWFEILEFDIEVRSQTLGDLDDDHIFKRWHQHMLVSSIRLGKPHGNAVDRKLAKAMVNAGYVDVVERKWPIPIGTWPAKPDMKRLGMCTLDFLEQSIEGFGLFLLKEILGFTYEEVQVTLAELRSALRNPKNTPLYYL